MSQLIAMFCDIDDFCKWFEPLYMQRLLQSSQRQRVRQGQLTLSEIMTIIVYFHRSHYRDFKHYYTEYVEGHLRPYFPTLVSYSRFVELMPRTLVPLCGYLHTRKGRCTGLTFVDSTSLAVCHNRRISRHKVFAGYATRGKSSVGWLLRVQVASDGQRRGRAIGISGGRRLRSTIRCLRDAWPGGCGASSLGTGATSRALHKALRAQAGVDHPHATEHEAAADAAGGIG